MNWNIDNECNGYFEYGKFMFMNWWMLLWWLWIKGEERLSNHGLYGLRMVVWINEHGFEMVYEIECSMNYGLKL